MTSNNIKELNDKLYESVADKWKLLVDQVDKEGEAALLLRKDGTAEVLSRQDSKDESVAPV